MAAEGALQRLAVPAGLALTATLAWLAYLPGLSGGFLFDDYVNLDALGRFGVVDNWPVFWRYVTSGTADPFGRPVALLSFLFDARTWPAAPDSFLRTNLVIHLCNGLLLFLLLRLLGRAVDGASRRNDAAALFGAAAWLLHPLFISTTLYVVQRHAMLPATFTLAGLAVFALGRLRLQSTAGRDGMGLLVAGIMIGTILAILSKANGILLPLLAGVIELCIFRGQSGSPAADRRLRLTLLLLLALPALVVVGYVAEPLGRLHFVPANRPWSVGERLLTESRVMVDYLVLLVVPRSVSTGLFNDGYVVSHGLLAPWTTMASCLLLASLGAVAWWFRLRTPVLSCAVLFFFTGHLLESTTLPLELYFEHRNYLPALLLFWPLGRALARWPRPAGVRLAIGAGILGLLALVTFQRSTLWGQPEKLAALWALANPGSSRAQVTAAVQASEAGRPDLALARLEPEWRRRPNELQVAFNVVDARCSTSGLRAVERMGVEHAFAHTTVGALMMHRWLGQAIEVAASKRCKGLDLDLVERWIAAAQANARLGSARQKVQDLEPLRAIIAIRRGQPLQARIHFDASLRATVSPGVAARQAAILASSGYYREALGHLDLYERLQPGPRRPTRGMAKVHEWVLERQGYWPQELAVLRSRLNAEIEQSPAP